MSSVWTPSSTAAGTNGVVLAQNVAPHHHMEVPGPPSGPGPNHSGQAPPPHHLDSAHPTAAESSPESNNGDDDIGNDAEGVWSQDIEQSFQEALAIYPPCGRRKIILSDEGKMYGRNELIARYIKLRTGKTRTRKQVSSHIQVLARRKTKEIQAHIKDHNSKDKVLQTMASMSSAQIVSVSAMQNRAHGVHGPPNSGADYSAQDHGQRDRALATMATMSSAQIVSATALQQHKMPPHSPPGALNQSTHSMGVASSHLHQSHLQQAPPSSVNASIKSPPSPSTNLWNRGAALSQDIKPFNGGYDGSKGAGEFGPVWQDRSIAGPKLRLVEFSAYLEQQPREPETYHKHLFVHIGPPSAYTDPPLEPVDIRQIYDKFPEKKGGLKELYDKGPSSAFFLVKFWADLNTNVQEEAGAFYGVSSVYENTENVTIQCSTKVCSFGKQVVEKVETEYSVKENGRYAYRIHRSPMCEYMINFIHKLKQLPEKYMMNSVLENFTILQVVTNRDTQETLLCIAYVFEVSTSEHGAQHHIYRLVKD